jgi:hypothetical protein
MFVAPSLPSPRGPLSRSVIGALRAPAGTRVTVPPISGDPLADDDLHLALYVCYELHYRGWADVAPAWEWDSGLLAARHRLEQTFLRGLRAALAPAAPTGDAAAVVDALRDIVNGGDGPSVSSHVAAHGTIDQLRELAMHRSPYQLKEADPHTWAIPRLPAGRAKSALLRLQYDEYGDAEVGESHAELFAETMRALDLDPTYGHYVDVVPGVVLATVNLLTMFGLHRELVGACIGHLAVFEMTSVVPMGRYASAMRRLTGGARGARFYDVHVVADAVHEVIATTELVPGLLEVLPSTGPDILFGAASLSLLEALVAEHVVGAWARGSSSMLVPERLRLAS